MKLIGTSQPIHDAKAKVMGGGIYAGDFEFSGMLHAAIVFSTVPHAHVLSVNVEEALAVEGVVAVLHCFNTTDRAFNRYRTMKGQSTPKQDRIFNSHVRFVGDRIGCVVARTSEIARRAAALVQVEYEVLPCATTVQEALDGKIDNIHVDGAVHGKVDLKIGDMAEMSSGAVETVTHTFLPRITHMAMETHCCVASWDRSLEELSVWSPNQSVHGLRTVLGDLFEVPYERLRVVKTTMGGSFGGKQEWVLEPVAVAAAMRVGKPVKLVYNREETMISTISRAPIHASFTSHITKEGKIQSLGADVTLDTGAYLGNACDYLYALPSKFFRCYSYPYAYYTARAVCTNTPMSGAYRGWSAPEMYTMMEHNLNMAARALGIDPVELRLKNVAMPGINDRKSGLPLGEIRIKECIENGVSGFDWNARKAESAQFNQAGGRYRRGVSIACAGHVNGYYPRFPDYAGVSMRVTETGGVQVEVTLHDHGCGTVTAMKMIAAEVLALSPEQLSMGEGDTAHTPHDVGCFASRTTYVIGRAVMECAEKLRDLLIETCAEIHNTEAGALTIADGAVCLADGTRVPYGELAVYMLKENKRELWVTHQGASDSNPGVAAAHFAWVEVDTFTGMVRVLDYLAVHDIGQAINREICIAQIQGAVAMGYGAAITEHMDTNARSGKTTGSMKDYHVVNAPDMPVVRVELIEDGSMRGPFGAKSIGEISYAPVAAAMVGAVNDALGSSLCRLPLNSDAIVKLIMEGETA